MKIINSGLALLVFVAVTTLARPAASESSKGFILHQQLRDLGPITVWVNDKAVAVNFDKYGCKLVTNAPNWQIYLFRPTEKTIWQCSLDQLSVRRLANLDQDIQIKRPDKTTPVKLPSLDHWIKDKTVFVLGNGIWYGFAYRTFSSTHMSYHAKHVLNCLIDFPVAPQCSAVIGQLSGLGLIDQMPLFIKKTRFDETQTYVREHLSQKVISYSPSAVLAGGDLRTGPQVLLSTSKIICVQLPDNTFTVPANYRKVLGAPEVMYSSDYKKHGYDWAFGDDR